MVQLMGVGVLTLTLVSSCKRRNVRYPEEIQSEVNSGHSRNQSYGILPRPSETQGMCTSPRIDGITNFGPPQEYLSDLYIECSRGHKRSLFME